ncbi:restriction endonuclease subunit S [Thermincola potens]|nr:restriction endonuclease subunit S [Thermincola potens]
MSNQMNLTRLGNICTKIGSGLTPKGGKNAYKESGISFIRSLNIYDFHFDYTDLAYIDDNQARKLSNVIVERHDILLNITGASVARCCMVPDNVLPARVNQHVSIVRIDKSKANPYYVLYSLNSPINKQRLLTLAQGGATREALTKETISNFEINLPSLTVQNKIAAILSAYDDLIENNTRRIKILEEMAQLIYREWFVKFRFPGHEKVRMVESELGPIPEGWKVKTLGEVCNIVMGQSPESKYYNTKGEGLPFHQGVSNFNNRYPTHEVYCTIDKRIAHAGDILFSVRAPVGRINIADRKLIVGRGLAAIRHIAGLQSFLYYQMKAIFKEEDIIGNGAIFNSITKQDLLNVKVIVPSDCVDNDFNNKVEHIDQLILNLTRKNLILRRTRDLLLPKLISGELDVEDLDIAIGGD